MWLNLPDDKAGVINYAERRDFHTDAVWPFCIAGLFWRLVALEDGLDDSASESLLVSIDTITSFIPEVFSWEDSSSSEGTPKEKTDDSWEKKTTTTVKHPSDGTHVR